MQEICVSLDKQFNLARSIARALQLDIVYPEIITFADGEYEIKLPDPSQFVAKRVFIIQSTYRPVNDHILQLLFTVHALKNASAQDVIGVVPYFGYARHEKSAQFCQKSGEAAVVAALFKAAGYDRIVTVAVHASEVMDFFSMPSINCTLESFISEYIIQQKNVFGGSLDNLVLVAPDQGARDRVAAVADHIGCRYLLYEKERYGSDKSRVIKKSTDVSVAGKNALIIDDMVDTGGTVLHVAELLHQQGIAQVFGFFIHPVFSGDIQHFMRQGRFAHVFVTDTIPLPIDHNHITVLSIADQLVQCMQRIRKGV